MNSKEPDTRNMTPQEWREYDAPRRGAFLCVACKDYFEPHELNGHWCKPCWKIKKEASDRRLLYQVAMNPK